MLWLDPDIAFALDVCGGVHTLKKCIKHILMEGNVYSSYLLETKYNSKGKE